MNSTESCACGLEPCECEVKPDDLKEFLEHAKGLVKVLRRVRRYLPTANYYGETNTLHLMSGPAHTGQGGTARYDRIKAEFDLPDGCDSGAW